MLLDAAHARFELADQVAVAGDGGVVFDHRATQALDLLAQFLGQRQNIGRYVCAQLMHFGPQFGQLVLAGQFGAQI